MSGRRDYLENLDPQQRMLLESFYEGHISAGQLSTSLGLSQADDGPSSPIALRTTDRAGTDALDTKDLALTDEVPVVPRPRFA